MRGRAPVDPIRYAIRDGQLLRAAQARRRPRDDVAMRAEDSVAHIGSAPRRGSDHDDGRYPSWEWPK